MTIKKSSIDARAAAFARQAQQTATGAQGQRRALRDPFTGHGIHAPVILAQRGKTKRTTTGPSVAASLTGIVAEATFGALTGVSSASQQAGNALGQLLLGQRIS